MSAEDPAAGRCVVGPTDDNEPVNQDLPLANIITLGVGDIPAEREFYRRLGWPLVLDTDDFVVFELRGALLALFGIDNLGRDAHAVPERGRGGIRSSIIITADRPEDLDELTERARAAGARITKGAVAAEFFEGRDAYFADPEGNYWEVAWSADILYSGEEVLPIGGFLGNVPAPTLATLQADISRGYVRVFVLPVSPPGPDPRVRWIESHCVRPPPPPGRRPVPYADFFFGLPTAQPAG